LPAGTPDPSTVALPALRFGNVLDNYSLSASVAVPVSDYLLRLNHGYRDAIASERAASLDTRVARARAATDARVAFYQWIGAREGIAVAAQSLADRRTHLAEVEQRAEVGEGTPADVLRARTAVANAELGVADAQSSAAVLERQLRIAMHAPDEEPLVPSEALDASLPRLDQSMAVLLGDARASRPELSSLDNRVIALQARARALRGSQLPAVSLFADGIYANPNPRYFPPAPAWHATWDVGIQVSWSPSEAAVASAATREAEAGARQLVARHSDARDAIDLEVQRAYQDAVRSDAAIASSTEELASATEAYRAAGLGFRAGETTSAELSDVETELTRARFDLVNARCNARVARARLVYATGHETAGESPR
jgi:outer membrane protein TolC